MTYRGLLAVLFSAVVTVAAGPGAASDGARPAFPAVALLFSGPPLPDGTRAAYAVNANGSGLKRLPVSGLLSPDGKRVVFVRCRTNCVNEHSGGSIHDLYVSAVDGARTRRVGTWKEGESSAGLSWAPDSRRLAYGAALAASWVRIVDVRTGRLLHQIEGAEDPLWSPDGRLLAVRGARGLYTVRPDGSDWHLIADVYAHDPSWSPDSRWLVFEDDDALVRVSADGMRRRLVLREADLASASSADISSHPSWSPRGDWIAFVGEPEHPEWGVYLVRPDGTGLRRVLDLGPWGFRRDALAWSPDGRSLAATVVAGLYSTSVVLSDVFVIDVASGRSRRVTQGWRYGSENVVAQWHPRALPTSRFPGAPATPALPSDTLVAAAALKTTRVVDRLAADGSRVAYTFLPPTYVGTGNRELYRSSTLNCAELWEPVASQVVRLREPCSGTPWGPQGVAVAGERVAWVESILGPIAGSNSNSAYAGTVAAPAPRPLLQTGNEPLGNLVGDGDLLVFDTWARNGGCIGSECHTGDKRGGRLFRFDGGSAARLITSSSGPVTPLSVDSGRVLVDRGGGLLELMSADGASLRSFQLNGAIVRGARLQGRDLVVLTTTAVEVTDAETGAFLRRWPVDNAQLADVQDGIAVLVSGREIHLIRLADGRDAVIAAAGPGPVQAQLEPSGLFYSYRADDAKYPGRVVFVPFDLLPLR